MIYFCTEVRDQGTKVLSKPLEVGECGVTLNLQVSHWDYFRSAFLPKGSTGITESRPNGLSHAV